MPAHDDGMCCIVQQCDLTVRFNQGWFGLSAVALQSHGQPGQFGTPTFPPYLLHEENAEDCAGNVPQPDPHIDQPARRVE